MKKKVYITNALENELIFTHKYMKTNAEKKTKALPEFQVSFMTMFVFGGGSKSSVDVPFDQTIK